MNEAITPEAEDDTEGHRVKGNRVSEAGEDDTEGHVHKRNH